MNREDAKVRDFVYNYGRGKITLGAIPNVKLHTFYIVVNDAGEYFRYGVYPNYEWVESFTLATLWEDYEKLIAQYRATFSGPNMRVKKITIIEEEDTE